MKSKEKSNKDIVKVHQNNNDCFNFFIIKDNKAQGH